MTTWQIGTEVKAELFYHSCYLQLLHTITPENFGRQGCEDKEIPKRHTKVIQNGCFCNAPVLYGKEDLLVFIDDSGSLTGSTTNQLDVV